jgi:pilus assembly protein Flp/PilA
VEPLDEDEPMPKLCWKVRGFLVSEKGQDLAEYALLVGLIAIVVIMAVTVLGENLSIVFRRVGYAIGWIGGRYRKLSVTPFPWPLPVPYPYP